MTPTHVAAEPTLDQARERFLTAEQELQAAAAALRRLQVATEQLSGAQNELGQATATLALVEREFAAAAGVLQNATAEIRRGVDSLGQADPARLRSDFDEFSRSVKSLLSGLEQATIELPGKIETANSGLASQIKDVVTDSQDALGKQLVGSRDHLSDQVTGIRKTLAERLEEQERGVSAAIKNLEAASDDASSRLGTRLEAKLSALQAGLQAEARERGRQYKEIRILVAVATAIMATVVVLARVAF